MSTPERELAAAEARRAELEAEREAARQASLGSADRHGDADVEGATAVETTAGPAGHEVTIAFSPRQILGGFTLLAAVIVWLFRRRKR